MAAENLSISEAAFQACQWADGEIEQLLNDVYTAAKSESTTDGPTLAGYNLDDHGKEQPIDVSSGSGALIIDKYLSDLSNVESISAQGVSTSLKINKEINAKMG